MSRDRRCLRNLLLPSVVLAGFASAPAFQAKAETAQSAAADASEPRALDAVIVTAQRRAANLQREAIAVSALAGDTIEKANITDLSGLNGYVPGLLAERSSGSELMISIRGVGSETPQNLYTQPGVSVFVDGLYIPTALGVWQGFFDVDRLEVLRGPQGTLFGQSSTGGAISIVSKQPVLGQFSGDLQGSYGNYDLNREFLSLNVPIGDTLAIRGVVQHQQHSGFGKDITLGDYGLDAENDLSGKLSLLWKPTANFSATLTARDYYEDHNGAEQKNILDPNPNPRQVEQDFGSHLRMNYQTYSLVIGWDLPFMSVKSVTGYQNMNNNQSIDDARLTASILGFYNVQPQWISNSETWTQEVDLLSKPGGKLDWIVGVFYINSDEDQNIAEFSGPAPTPTSFYIPPITGPSPNNIAYEEYSVISRQSWAPFFQFTYHFTDRLRFTGGARYNHDAYSGRASFYYSPLAAVPSYSSGTPTGKAELEYDVTPVNMVYASWTRGYKPGGINNAYNGTSLFTKQDFNAEIVNSYEVGSKNEFFDRSIRLNLAGFYAFYNNMQYLSSDPVLYQDGTGNIPTARIWGGEMEGSWLALDGRLRVNGNLTVLGGVFGSHYNVLDAQAAATARAAYEAAHPGAGDFDAATIAAVAAAAKDIYGNEPPKLPHLAASINASYAFAIGENVITPKIEYVYRGSFVYRVFNESALDNVPAYGILNMYVEYVPPVKNLRFTLAGTNLTNVAGIGGRFTDPYGSGQTSNEYIAPRQVVVSAEYSF